MPTMGILRGAMVVETPKFDRSQLQVKMEAMSEPESRKNTL